MGTVIESDPFDFATLTLRMTGAVIPFWCHLLWYSVGTTIPRHKVTQMTSQSLPIDRESEPFTTMLSGEVYLPGEVGSFFELQARLREVQNALNATPLTDGARRRELEEELFAEVGDDLFLECPVYANWGCNTHWGSNCYANFNLTLVDDGEIFIGDHAMFGPNVTLVTTGHPIRPDLRLKSAQYSLPVHIGRNVWLGAGVSVMPGVSIGDNSVVGAHSLVTHDIPANTVAYGCPCKPVRPIGPHDERYYWRDRTFSPPAARD